MIDKRVKTAADAVAGVRDGSTVLVAGFGAVGVADHLLDALHEQGARELTIVANNSGNGDYGFAPDAAPPDTNLAVGAAINSAPRR